VDLLQLGANVLGSGLATAGIGAWFKAGFDKQLETQKALLERASRIHERQVDALATLYASLREAHDYAQLMTKSATFVGENPDAYPVELMRATKVAYEKFTATRILLPSAFAETCEAFFAKLQEAQVNYGFARQVPEIAPPQRADAWKRAGVIAYQEMPSLLKSLEDAARQIIHRDKGLSFKVVARAS
jgi:hypothetical protein